jgi:hypothetical protein
MKIDVLVGEPQFVDHTTPVYKALPESSQGDYIVRSSRNTPLNDDALIARASRQRVFATTEATDPTRPILVTSWGDHQAARKMGRTRIARMEHGIGQSFIDSDHQSYAGGKDAADVELFLCPNQHSADRWQNAYPNARVEIVGCPKLDTLPAREPEEGPVVALSFHWAAGLVRQGPLGETQGSFHEYRTVLSQISRKYTVIGHGHPRAMAHLERIYRRFGIPVVKDFADVCRQADLYVCDTNSTIYEFASTGRPVVVVNGKHFRRDVNHGLRFWNAAGVGVQCDSPSELSSAIDQALVDTRKQQRAREAALDITYAYRTGAAERAADVLKAWAGGRTTAIAA